MSPTRIIGGALRRLFPKRYPEYKMRRRLSRNFQYDNIRYWRNSGLNQQESIPTLEALVTMDYHRLEKGLSLRSPRPDFGASTASDLFRNLQILQDLNHRTSTWHIALGVLHKYIAFRRDNGCDVQQLEKLANELGRKDEEHLPTCGGTIDIVANDILSAAKTCPEAFFNSRHSIRDFSSAHVDRELVQSAVKIALRSPSVCNRQPWRVIAIDNPSTLGKVLELQNGNRSFRSQIPCVLTVFCDLTQFVSVGERNQAWIDGGMFSMSLVYALHSLGLGTCCLNWSVELETDTQLRQQLRLPESAAVVMMIAVGHLPERLKVASSARKSVGEILCFVE
jgi:nitroreductase